MCSPQALIIGGSRGIGYSIAKKFAMSGYNVTIMSKNMDNLTKCIDNLKNECRLNSNVQINGYVCDIRSERSVNDSFKNIDKSFGRIEVMVNAAAINVDKLLFNFSSQQINDIIDTNLIGTIFTSKAILRTMILNKSGSIVNIGSIVGLNGNIGQTIYAASKSALIGFSKSLAKEVASKGIRVNVIAPGFVRTDMTSNLMESKIEQKIPMNRIGCAEEIAEVAYFVANASYITGEVVIVDGGLHLNC